MKKFFISLAVLAGVIVASGTLFKEPLWNFVAGMLTSDMYVAADTDAFDPGLPVGASFPAIRALHDGRELVDVGEFIRDKGMIFIANRSADW